MSKSFIAESDFQSISEKTKTFLPNFKNAKIFITGATGFFGCWLLETFLYLNKFHNLNIKITALTRDLNAFEQKSSYLSNSNEIEFIHSDIVNLNIDNLKNFTHIIDAATDIDPKKIINRPEEFLDNIYLGTKNILKIANQSLNCKYLYISSGAIYGKQNVSNISENNFSAPDLQKINSLYGEAKRIAELLTTIHNHKYKLNNKIARCYSFIGPYMKIDGHFAIGNFIKDVINENDISINSDGKTKRSYLYAADLIIWLLTILELGQTNSSYNVGSDEEISIKDLAALVLKATQSKSKIKFTDSIGHNTSGSSIYMPSILKAKTELNLDIWTNLESAIYKTYIWNQNYLKNKS